MLIKDFNSGQRATLPMTRERETVTMTRMAIVTILMIVTRVTTVTVLMVVTK